MSSLPGLTSTSGSSTENSNSPSLSARCSTTERFVTLLTPPPTNVDHCEDKTLSTTFSFPQKRTRTTLVSTSLPSSRLSVPSPSRSRIKLPNYILRWDQARPLSGNIRTIHHSLNTSTTGPKASATRIAADDHQARPSTIRPRSKAKAWQMEKINYDLNRKIRRILPCRALGRRHRKLAMVCKRDQTMSPEGVDRTRRMLQIEGRTFNSGSEGACRVCCLVQCECLRRSETLSAVEERVRMRSREAFTNPPWLVAGSGWKGNVRIRRSTESSAKAGPLRKLGR